MTPQADLMRWLGEPFSPVAALHYALREPIGADALPDLFFAYGTFDEKLGNSSGEHVLGVAGIPVSGRTFFTALPTLTGAISANLTTPNGTITAAGWIFESDHSVIRSRDDDRLSCRAAAFGDRSARAHQKIPSRRALWHFFRRAQHRARRGPGSGALRIRHQRTAWIQ
jgi:hypothetical protein